jgi:hypothetical protein
MGLLPPGFEKSPLSSKKFLALSWANLGWYVLLGVGIWVDLNMVVLLAMVITLGFIQVGYIIGQAGLDAYVRAAATVASTARPPDSQP